MNIEDIIQLCGGAVAIAQASATRRTQITYRGVYKWRVNGIPSHWFELIGEMSGVDANSIHFANTKAPGFKKKYEIIKKKECAV